MVIETFSRASNRVMTIITKKIYTIYSRLKFDVSTMSMNLNLFNNHHLLIDKPYHVIQCEQLAMLGK